MWLACGWLGSGLGGLKAVGMGVRVAVAEVGVGLNEVG